MKHSSGVFSTMTKSSETFYRAFGPKSPYKVGAKFELVDKAGQDHLPRKLRPRSGKVTSNPKKCQEILSTRPPRHIPVTTACCRWSLAVRGGGGCKGRATLTCAKKGTALVHHFVNRGRGGSATRTDLPVFSLHESLSLMQIVAQSTIPKSTSALITMAYFG